MIKINDCYMNASCIHGVWIHGSDKPFRVALSYTDDDGVCYLDNEYATKQEAQAVVDQLVADIDAQTMPGLLNTLEYYLGTISRNLPR